jgi:hypothetical protein
MVQDKLSDTLVSLTPVIALATLLTWMGALILYYSLKEALTKITSAQSLTDLSRFRCETVARRMKRFRIFHKFFLIMTIIIALNYVLGVILRVLLMRERISAESGFYDIAFYIVRPVSILVLLQGVAAVTMTRTVNRYFTILTDKCRKLGVTDGKTK